MDEASEFMYSFELLQLFAMAIERKTAGIIIDPGMLKNPFKPEKILCVFP